MVKRNKKVLILTSIIILFPILVGLLLWNRLPERIPTHWNFSGEIDGWSGKPFGVFFLPLFLLAMHWFCVGCMAIDPKQKNIGGKAEAMVFWMMPVMSVVMSFFIYGVALGLSLSVNRVMGVLVGLMYLIVGNYMPKCKRNYTVGYKLPWTLDNDENFSKTHRLAGKCWVVSGILLLLSAMLGGFWIALAIAMVLSFVPMVYSYRLYRKQKAEESPEE